ncbi:MAG: YceI family protein [Pseudomonadota bacterium]
MKCTATAALLALAPCLAAADMVRYELDASHTAVYFTIDHIGYAKTLGIFEELSGAFMFDPDSRALGDVRVEIDAASINTFNRARDRHVRNADFLHVSSHPEITFVANGGTARTAQSGRVRGELTILGQTQPVTLDVTLNKEAPYPFGHGREVLGLSITAEIDRSDFGMTYGVANGLVGDTVTINIETEAMRMD